MKRFFAVMMVALLPLGSMAKPDPGRIKARMDLNLPVNAYLSASYGGTYLFGGLDIVVPKRFPILLKVTAGRSEIADLTSQPGQTAVEVGTQLKFRGLYFPLLVGYSDDGFVLEGNLRTKRIKRIAFEGNVKYTYDNTACWWRLRPDILLRSGRINKLLIGLEYVWSGWEGGKYYTAKGGMYVRFDILTTRIVLGGGSRGGGQDHGAYGFIEVSNRLF